MATLSQPTLSRLLREVRIFLNQPVEANSFWKNDELTIYINDAIRQYFLVVQENAEGQFDTTASLDVINSTNTVVLPSDCFEVRALYAVKNGFNQILRYDNNLNSSYDTIVNNDSESYSPSYYFRENSLVLRPMPGFSGAGVLFLEYTKFPETLITGGDTMTSGISPIFKELVVKYACYQAKLKESSVQGGNTYLAVERHLADLYQTFKQSVGGRAKYPQFIVPFNP